MHDERKQDATRQAAAEAELGRVRELAEPLAVAHGLEICDVEWNGRVLRVIIDRPEPRDGAPRSDEYVSVDDCVTLSRDLSTALDAEDFIAQSYSLEVSSPGLDRPLRSARDFRRHRGKLAKVRLHTPAADGQRVLRGVLLDAGDEGMVMEVDGKRHEVALANVAEAKLVFELAPRPRSGRKRRRKSS